MAGLRLLQPLYTHRSKVAVNSLHNEIQKRNRHRRRQAKMMVATILVFMATILVFMAFLTPAISEGSDICEADRGSAACNYDCHELFLVRLYEGLECSTDRHNNVKFALQVKDSLEKWLSDHNLFKILILGKMGTGKTTLARGFKENFAPEKEDNLLSHTTSVTSYEHTQNGIKFVLVDTPGFNDDTEESNFSHLREIVKKGEPDMIIFAVKMDDEFRMEDMNTIENLSNAFGWRIWENAVVILTFANKVHLEGKDYDSRENKKFYNDKKNDFELKITESLRKNRAEKEVANNIPVIPVGLVSQPFIPSDERQVSWVEEFWESIFTVWESSGKKRSKRVPPTTGSSEQRPSSHQVVIFASTVITSFWLL